MDFLRNIASAALQSTGVSFPFTIGERIPGTEGKTIWDIREGIKKVSLTVYPMAQREPSFEIPVTDMLTAWPS